MLTFAELLRAAMDAQSLTVPQLAIRLAPHGAYPDDEERLRWGSGLELCLRGETLPERDEFDALCTALGLDEDTRITWELAARLADNDIGDILRMHPEPKAAMEAISDALIRSMGEWARKQLDDVLNPWRVTMSSSDPKMVQVRYTPSPNAQPIRVDDDGEVSRTQSNAPQVPAEFAWMVPGARAESGTFENVTIACTPLFDPVAGGDGGRWGVRIHYTINGEPHWRWEECRNVARAALAVPAEFAWMVPGARIAWISKYDGERDTGTVLRGPRMDSDGAWDVNAFWDSDGETDEAWCGDLTPIEPADPHAWIREGVRVRMRAGIGTRRGVVHRLCDGNAMCSVQWDGGSEVEYMCREWLCPDSDGSK